MREVRVKAAMKTVKAAKVRHTLSVCPICMNRVAAEVVRRGNEHYIDKTCPEHGFFSTVVWRGNNPSYVEWGANYVPIDDAAEEGIIWDCPTRCGLCAGHLQKTCCALVEVTNRCDLRCPVCFAESGWEEQELPEPTEQGQTVPEPTVSEPSERRQSVPEPTVQRLSAQFAELVRNGNTFVQISGGEPTQRDDLIDIIKAAKAAGCENIQLNTNGIKLGGDKRYAKELREAGLSFVFMQFDGTEDDIHIKLRGRPLLSRKMAAIDNCSAASLGVTLVPTLVPGVNTHNIGDIVDFAISKSPAVRGVHFQPISYFGRYPHEPQNEERITLPEVLLAIEEQSGGKLSLGDFAPSRCDHPYCGFHGDFVVLPKKALLKLTVRSEAPCCGEDEHLKNRNFVARRWNRTEPEVADDGGGVGDGGGVCGAHNVGDCEGKGSIDDDDVGDGNSEGASDGNSVSASDGVSVDANDGNSVGVMELDAFARRLKSHGFTITAMAFQDAYNLDIERLRRCSLHVSVRRDDSSGVDGLVPFCARYMTHAIET
ncbi:MAG: radical SAM protein [Oscillospiraceae bacterium]|nr:radical SAM protein [Oscillospiraceae bacterium]